MLQHRDEIQKGEKFPCMENLLLHRSIQMAFFSSKHSFLNFVTKFAERYHIAFVR
jgi:hypothetical protein